MFILVSVLVCKFTSLWLSVANLTLLLVMNEWMNVLAICGGGQGTSCSWAESLGRKKKRSFLGCKVFPLPQHGGTFS